MACGEWCVASKWTPSSTWSTPMSSRSSPTPGPTEHGEVITGWNLHEIGRGAGRLLARADPLDEVEFTLPSECGIVTGTRIRPPLVNKYGGAHSRASRARYVAHSRSVSPPPILVPG
jgi:hypothetical protein